MRSLIKKPSTSTAFRVKIQQANALRDDKDFAAAAAAYREALNVNPRHAGAWGQLGNMLKDSGQFNEAQVAYETALEIKESSDIYLQLGHLFNLQGNRTKASYYYEKSLTVDRDNHHAFVALSQCNPSSRMIGEMGYSPKQMEARSELQDLMTVLVVKLSDRSGSFSVRGRK